MARRKIRFKRLVLFFILIIIIGFLLYKFLMLRITNIYVSGNLFLSDQEIIELGNLQNYPKTVFLFSSSIKSKIEKSDYVKSADVYKKGFTKLYVNVVENKPLFYDSISDKVVLEDGSVSSVLLDLPILTTYVKDTVYMDFLNKFSLIDGAVFSSISEIFYTPNEVDDELFMLMMNDGNYIYVNLNKFSSINQYFDFIVNFNGHKGVLYLDSGEYFKILDN